MTIKIANALFAKHNLTGWRFTINPRLSRAGGRCCYSRKIIDLSKTLMDTQNIYIVAQVIIHEIAHALTSPKERPHGKVWKENVLRIGGIPSTSVVHNPTPKQLKIIKDIIDPIIYPKIVINPIRTENPKARDETLKRLNRTRAKPRQNTIDKWKLIRNAEGLWV